MQEPIYWKFKTQCRDQFEDLTRFLKKIVVGLMQLFAQIFDLAANICYWSDGEAESIEIK